MVVITIGSLKLLDSRTTLLPVSLIERAGHDPPTEQRSEVTTAVRTFMSADTTAP